MSYVLDALRRAESERARGELPGLHAQPLPAAAPVGGATATPRRIRAIVALTAAALLMLAAAAWWMRAEAPSREAVIDPTAPGPARAGGSATAGPDSDPTPRSPAGASVAADPEPADAPAATDPGSAASPGTQATAAAQPGPPAAPARSVGAMPVPPRPVVREPMPPPPADDAPAPAGAATLAADARIPTLAELPPALRAQLPPLAFGGATDSPQASARMLIVNGQVAREGDEIAPGLVLERIRLRSAQLRFQGRRFVVDY